MIRVLAREGVKPLRRLPYGAAWSVVTRRETSRDDWVAATVLNQPVETGGVGIAALLVW